MATFRVGQSVKKVRGTRIVNDGLGVPIGGVATFAGYEHNERGTLDVVGRISNIETDSVVVYEGQRWMTRSDSYEPIQPEGYKVVAWSSCLWQPEGEHA